MDKLYYPNFNDYHVSFKILKNENNYFLSYKNQLKKVELNVGDENLTLPIILSNILYRIDAKNLFSQFSENDQKLLESYAPRLGALALLNLKKIKSFCESNADKDTIIKIIELNYKYKKEMKSAKLNSLIALDEKVRFIRTDDDKLLVIKPLGKGGWKKVYLAADLVLNKLVALAYSKKNIEHEFKIMKMMEKNCVPSVVRPYKFFSRIIKEKRYINVITNIFTMEYCNEGSIYDQIYKKIFSDKEIVSLALQIVEGLIGIHKNGIVHKDIKPGNIFLNNSKVKIGDFGIARSREERSVSNSTPLYNAPESDALLLTHPVLDIFALGITLYQMRYKKPINNSTSTTCIVMDTNKESSKNLERTRVVTTEEREQQNKQLSKFSLFFNLSSKEFKKKLEDLKKICNIDEPILLFSDDTPFMEMNKEDFPNGDVLDKLIHLLVQPNIKYRITLEQAYEMLKNIDMKEI